MRDERHAESIVGHINHREADTIHSNRSLTDEVFADDGWHLEPKRRPVGVVLSFGERPYAIDVAADVEALLAARRVSHAPLEGSKIPFSENEGRQIKDSKRFRDVLEEYTVDLWLSGHLHLPNEFTNTINRNPKFENTLFVHISSIRPEFLGFKHSQSRIVEFLCGKNIVRIKSRDHESSKWNNQLQGDYKLSKIVECN